MKTYLLYIFLLSGNILVFGQSPSERDSIPAKVYIIGVVHNENENRNADSLFNILKSIKPDLILSESDNLSGYFNKDYSLVTPPNWYRIARKMNLIKKMIPEMKVLYSYKKYAAAVSIYPFDIAIPKRRKYAKNYYKNEKKFVADINLASANNEIPQKLATYHNDYVKYSNWLFETGQKGYFHLNQKGVTDSSKQMIDYEAVYFPKVFESVPRLYNYKHWHIENFNFWKIRNETMSNNILKFIQLRNAKTIVVLTGLLHKYYLINLLEAAKKENNIELLEFYKSSLGK